MPVWSVTEGQASIFFPLMYAGWAIMLAFFVYDEAAGQTDTAHAQNFARVEAVLLRFSMMVIPIAAVSMIASFATILGAHILDAHILDAHILDAVRRFIVSIANRLYNRLAQPIEAIGEARGIDIGEARGEARGIAIGETRGIARALEWAQRKTQAESEGRPFDEPPPTP